MTDKPNVQTSQELPYGAKEIRLGSPDFSEALAIRLAESGASDEAIDAAGGPGTADRLHDTDVRALREAEDAVASSAA
jgi:hypothetical protein